MKRTKIISLVLVCTLILNMIIPIIPVIANTSYVLTFTVSGEHTLTESGNHLSIDGQFVDPREATDYTVNVDGNTATITINDGTPTTLNFNTANKFELFANSNVVNNNTNFSGNTEIIIQDIAPVSTYTLTFNVKEGLTGANYTISNDGNHLKIGDVYVDLIDAGNPEENIAASVNVNGNTATMVSSGSMAGKLGFNTNKFSLVANGQVVTENTIFDKDTAIQIEEYREENNNGGNDNGNPGYDTQNCQGNGTSTLNYNITGVIEYTSGGGYNHGISFKINDIPYRADDSKITYTEDTAYERDGNGQIILDDNNNPIVIKDPETMEPMTEKTGLNITGDTIHYDYDTNTNKVRFTFCMAPGTLMTGLKINNQTINNLPHTREELEACYRDHTIEIDVDDIDKADTYNIEIEARYPNSNEEFLGNFLWDYNPEGYTGPDDKILNGTLAFVEAEYKGVKYTTEEEINSLGGVYIWRDAVRKKKYTDEREGVGEAQFPVGTKLTVKIIPDAGYQLVDFGVNGGVFDPQEEIGTYTFIVEGGPFHLQATIAQVEDVVKTKSEQIASGSITLGGTEKSMTVGTARLDVDDIELTSEQISNFEEAAEGYDIKNYIDISLFNTVFKGKETESWDTAVKDLENEATITLKLEEGVNGEEIVIVHEKHDGTYEIIPVQYDPETNTITFKTKSFSNYAIATKQNEQEKYTIEAGDFIVVFSDDEGHEFKLTVMELMNLTDEELKLLDLTRAEYEEAKKELVKRLEKYGTILNVYNIMIENEDEKEHTGEVIIKIKMTDEMKKYNTFKLICIDEDTIGEKDVVELKEENGYLVGHLYHLSSYALVGEYVEAKVINNPKTGDNIGTFIAMFTISALGVFMISKSSKMKKAIKH